MTDPCRVCVILTVSRLSPDEYQADIIPRVVKLFASNDRGTRMQLLERLETLLPNIDSPTLNNQVFQHIVTGTPPGLGRCVYRAGL